MNKLIKKLRPKYEEYLTNYESSKSNYTDEEWYNSGFYVELTKDFKFYRLLVALGGSIVDSDKFRTKSFNIKSYLLNWLDTNQSLIAEGLMYYSHSIELNENLNINFEGHLIGHSVTRLVTSNEFPVGKSTEFLLLGDYASMDEEVHPSIDIFEFYNDFKIIDGGMGTYIFHKGEFIGTGRFEDTGSIRDRKWYLNGLVINIEDYE